MSISPTSARCPATSRIRRTRPYNEFNTSRRVAEVIPAFGELMLSSAEGGRHPRAGFIRARFGKSCGSSIGSNQRTTSIQSAHGWRKRRTKTTGAHSCADGKGKGSSRPSATSSVAGRRPQIATASSSRNPLLRRLTPPCSRASHDRLMRKTNAS